MKSNLRCPGLFCFGIKKNDSNFLIFDENKVKIYKELASNIILQDEHIIYEGRASAAIWIEEEIVAFTSMDNLLRKNQKNKIIIFNLNRKILLKEIDVYYSFNLCQNSLAIMKMKEHKILLYACKKYIKSQKNGILIINYNLKNGNGIIEVEDFENTYNFEIYCFCQISTYEKLNKTKILSNKYKITETNYFLVGGFEKEKGKSAIKLYEMEYDNKYKKIKINYVEDVFINEYIFKKYRGPISCIIQSIKNGIILASCWDGNIYMIEPPKIENKFIL